MKDEFRGYYRPSAAEFKNLWQAAHFSVDANVLLDVFRFSEATTNVLLAALTAVESRLWLSHQAAAEYHQNLPEVLSTGARECQEVLKTLAELEVRLGLKDPHKKRAPPHVSAATLKAFGRVKKALTKETQKNAEVLLDQLQDHPLKERLAKLFKGKIGRSLTEEALNDLYKDGKARYARLQPPGFCDAKKPEPDRYGDLVVWRQMMDHCKAAKVGLVFITDDQKEDWFLESSGRTLGPRPELIEEFWQQTGQPFYCYSVARFLELATGYLKVEVSRDAIDEAKEAPPTVPSPAAAPFVTSLSNSGLQQTIAPLAGSLNPQFSTALSQLHTSRDLLGPSENLLTMQKQIADLYGSASESATTRKWMAELTQPLAGMESVRKQMEEITKPLAGVQAMIKQMEEAARPLKGIESSFKYLDDLMKPLREPETSRLIADYKNMQAQTLSSLSAVRPSLSAAPAPSPAPNKKDEPAKK